MHEWALAEGIVSTALKEAKRGKFTEVTRINVKIGELQQIDGDLFVSLLKEILQVEDPKLKRAEVVFENQEAILKCRVGGHEWLFSESKKGLSDEDAELIHFVPEIAHVYIRCPACKSPDFEVTKGRGVWLESIEGE